MRQTWRLLTTIPPQLTRPFSTTPEALLTTTFRNLTNPNDIASTLSPDNLVLSSDTILKVLRSLETEPLSASRFFNWVPHKTLLSSKSYNKMLCILGSNGRVHDFWAFFEVMQSNGFCILKGVRDIVIERFRKDGLVEDVRKLERIYENSPSVCRIVRNEVWGDEVEARVKGILERDGVSSQAIANVLEGLGTEAEAMKGLIFFRWVEESGVFKHDERTYNVMAKVLGREGCVDRFWKVADEMRNAGFEMDKETFVRVLERFSKKKMVNDIVDLFEFGSKGSKNKPSAEDFVFVLRKIAVGKSFFDLFLFSRAVKAYTSNGNVLSNSMFEAVLKALTSVGRLGECNKVLKVMEEAGFVPSGGLPGKIAYRLSSNGKQVEANELLEMSEVSGCASDPRTWKALIEGHCVAGDLENATDTFKKMVAKEDIASVDFVFEILANAYCRKNRAIDASNLLLKLVKEKEFKPRHTTYKLLVSKLLVQGGFKEALDLLSSMKSHGFPPFIDPCIEYVSRSGNADDALAFLKAMTTKGFPSKVVFLNLFEAFFKAKRRNEALDLLSKCPSFIRNHADVLNLFYVKRSGGVSDAAPMAA